MRTEGSKQKAEAGEETGTRNRGLGFWLLALLALMVSMTTLSYGRSHDSVAVGRAPTIILRVYNYTEASTGTIAQAESEAGYVFGQAGVAIVWLDCRARNTESGCSGPAGPDGFALRILTGGQKGQVELPENTFGFATFPSLASVYYSRVKIFAASVGADQECALMLGDVMAHEIGHLLLGPGHHSQTGIMKAQWQAQTLHDGIVRLLHFTPEQASELRIRASEHGEALRAEARENGPR